MNTWLTFTSALPTKLAQFPVGANRLERDQNILIETLALYVRYFLTVSIPVPEGQQEAARAQGRARFAQFIEQLGRHLQRGRSLVREVHEEIEPEATPMQAEQGKPEEAADGPTV